MAAIKAILKALKIPYAAGTKLGNSIGQAIVDLKHATNDETKRRLKAVIARAVKRAKAKQAKKAVAVGAATTTGAFAIGRKSKKIKKK